MRLTEVNRKKIAQELTDAKVQILKIQAIEGNNEIGADITFEEDSDMQLVQSIIDAHDPTPIPSKLSEMDILRDYVLDMELRMILKDLEV